MAGVRLDFLGNKANRAMSRNGPGRGPLGTMGERVFQGKTEPWIPGEGTLTPEYRQLEPAQL